MKPAQFMFARPETVDGAIAVLAEHGDDAKVLAGGQSLIPLMNMRLARPGVLVDIASIPALQTISGNGDLVIGATARQVQVQRSPVVAGRAPLVIEALRWVGHPAIRSRGTFGGCVAHADPAAELAAVVLALDGRIGVRGGGGERVVPSDDFFLGSYTTVLDTDEVLTHVTIPADAGSRRWGFLEIARRHGDFALAGVAATADVVAEGAFGSPRIVLFGVGDRPLRAIEAEDRLAGQRVTDDAACAEAANLAASGLTPRSDVHATAGYRRRVVAVLVRRVLEQIRGRESQWT